MKVNFKQFVAVWKSTLVYDVNDDSIDSEYFHEMYINYKEQRNIDDVVVFFEHWYEDVNLDTHSFMLKSKAITDPKYNKGLLELINKNDMKCKKCNSDLELMTGVIYLVPDNEDSKVEEVDCHVLARYCPKCDKITEVWED